MNIQTTYTIRSSLKMAKNGLQSLLINTLNHFCSSNNIYIIRSTPYMKSNDWFSNVDFNHVVVIVLSNSNSLTSPTSGVILKNCTSFFI